MVQRVSSDSSNRPSSSTPSADRRQTLRMRTWHNPHSHSFFRPSLTTQLHPYPFSVRPMSNCSVCSEHSIIPASRVENRLGFHLVLWFYRGGNLTSAKIPLTQNFFLFQEAVFRPVLYFFLRSQRSRQIRTELVGHLCLWDLKSSVKEKIKN